MGLIVNTTDFVGVNEIAQNDYSGLEQFITDNEANLIYDLLGKVLGDTFIADLSAGVPQTLIYQNIFNVINEDLYCGTVRNRGMKVMLIALMYFDYMTKNPFQSTISGQVINKNELSGPCFDNFGIAARYNNAIKDYKIIQDYIRKNIADYPDFKGINKETILPF